jgi:hypothetical protein
MPRDTQGNDLTAGDPVVVTLNAPFVVGAVAHVSGVLLANNQNTITIAITLPVVQPQNIAPGVFKLHRAERVRGDA